MSSQGREHIFRCPCYDEHMDYQKIVDLKDAGLIIYRQSTRNDFVNPIKNAQQSATSTPGDIFILHNTKDVEIFSADIMSNFDLRKISCPRCRQIIENAKKLVKSIPKINGNDIVGICDHCRRKMTYKPCQECDKVVQQFVTGREKAKSTKHHIKRWLSKIHHLLKDVVGEKHVINKDRIYSDINIQNLHHNSPLSLREPEVGDIFYSEILRTSSTKTVNLSDRSYHSHPNYPKVKKRTTFADVFGQEYFFSSKRKRLITRSHQDLTYTANDNLSLLEAMREDFRDRKSITDLSLKKLSLISTGKYKSEEIFKSVSDLSINKSLKTRHERYKSESALNSSPGLDSNKLSRILPEKYKSDNTLLNSISGYAANDYIKEGFGYLFLKDKDETKSQPQKNISSSELIKNTQDMLRARAEEKVKQLEERRKKHEDQERRRRDREEKRLAEEEAKRLAERERKRLAEEEKSRLAEEKAKKLAEEEKKCGIREQNKLSARDKKQPKVKPEPIKKEGTDTISKVKASPEEKKKTPIEATKKDEERQKSKEPGILKEKPSKIIAKPSKNVEKQPEVVGKSPKVIEKPSKTLKDKVEKPKKEKSAPVVMEKETKKSREVSDKQIDDKDKKEKELNKIGVKESIKEEVKQPVKPKADVAQVDDLRKLLADQAKEKDEMKKAKKQQEDEERKAREAADKKAKENLQVKATSQHKPTKRKQSHTELEPKPGKKQEKSTEAELNIKQIKLKKPSGDDLILQLVKLKQTNPAFTKNMIKKEVDVTRLLFRHKGHENNKNDNCIVCTDSDIELELESINKVEDDDKLAEIIIGQKIFKYKPPLSEKHQEVEELPVLFQSFYKEENSVNARAKEDIVKLLSEEIEPINQRKFLAPTKGSKGVEQEVPKGIVRYALSDRSFIDKGWTMLPTEKVVRKMNVYRMRPAQPEFDWFEHNKNKRLMQYDTGEKLAEFDDNGRGRWYYKNGRLALDYYDAEETNAQQRYVVYSSGEPDERGRSRPITILATFDYLGNGVVFDHSGKIRLKYNQTEGVVLDRAIGPVSHWKWHTLNDPPVLQQVMIDTQMSYKDPDIVKLGGPGDNKARPDNEEMLAIEFDNFIKEKSKKLTQKFKPFQIKMKALKINESFSLKVLDQATVYLIFRDGSANLKLNIGMILDHKEIVDTDTAEVGEVSNSLERLPARTDSIAGMQASVAHAARVERLRLERGRRLRPAGPCASADRLAAAASRPLRPPLQTAPSATSATSDYPCKCRKPSSSNLYYDTRLV